MTGRLLVPEMHHDWPQDWVDFYERDDKVSRDPFVRSAFETRAVFCHDVRDFAGAPMPPEIRKFYEHDVTQAQPTKLALPISVSDHEVLLFAAYGRHGRTEFRSAAIEGLGLLRLIAFAAEAKLMRVAPDIPVPQLSARQREVLSWLAAGLRNDRIAERMGITVTMVERHIALARRRLGARTREQAVARAVILGIIRP
jgi:DNA-binding CsgD family transcriptional regulator